MAKPSGTASRGTPKVAVRKTKVEASQDAGSSLAQAAAPAAKGGRPTPPVDRELRSRWESAIARYRRARADENVPWDERYLALGEILDGTPPYYLAGGYKSARAFLRDEVPDQDEATVRRAIRVARYFSAEAEARHGVAKLDALLDYLEATSSLPVKPTKIDPERFEIRLTDSRGSRAVSFAALSRDEIHGAARLPAPSARRATGNRVPLAQQIRDALVRADLGAIDVRLRGDNIDLNGISAQDLLPMARAILACKLVLD